MENQNNEWEKKSYLISEDNIPTLIKRILEDILMVELREDDISEHLLKDLTVEFKESFTKSAPSEDGVDFYLMEEGSICENFISSATERIINEKMMDLVKLGFLELGHTGEDFSFEMTPDGIAELDKHCLVCYYKKEDCVCEDRKV